LGKIAKANLEVNEVLVGSKQRQPFGYPFPVLNATHRGMKNQV